jgi:hypothetical protein
MGTRRNSTPYVVRSVWWSRLERPTPHFVEGMPYELRTKCEKLSSDLATKILRNQRPAFLPGPWGHGGTAPRTWLARFGGHVSSDPPRISEREFSTNSRTNYENLSRDPATRIERNQRPALLPRPHGHGNAAFRSILRPPKLRIAPTRKQAAEGMTGFHSGRSTGGLCHVRSMPLRQPNFGNRVQFSDFVGVL